MSPLFFPINKGETKREEVRGERRENEEIRKKRGGEKERKKNRERKREGKQKREETTEKKEEEKNRGAATNTTVAWNRRHRWPSLTTEASPGKPSAPLAFVSSLAVQEVHI
jgi:hypothetical protein